MVRHHRHSVPTRYRNVEDLTRRHRHSGTELKYRSASAPAASTACTGGCLASRRGYTVHNTVGWCTGQQHGHDRAGPLQIRGRNTGCRPARCRHQGGSCSRPDRFRGSSRTHCALRSCPYARTRNSRGCREPWHIRPRCRGQASDRRCSWHLRASSGTVRRRFETERKS